MRGWHIKLEMVWFNFDLRLSCGLEFAEELPKSKPNKPVTDLMCHPVVGMEVETDKTILDSLLLKICFISQFTLKSGFQSNQAVPHLIRHFKTCADSLRARCVSLLQ